MGLPLSPRLSHSTMAWLFSVATIVLAVSSDRHALGQDDNGIHDTRDRFGISVLIIEEQECESFSDEWCGWGTHDSCPDVRFEHPHTSHDATQASCEVKVSPTNKVANAMMVLATSVGSSVGVSVNQLLEPFAMVGPDACSTLDEIAWLTKYWTAPHGTPLQQVIDADAIADDIGAPNDVDFGIVSFVPFVDFDGLFESQTSRATPLASAAVVGTHDSTKSDQTPGPDWESHDDDRFNIVVSEDVIRMQLDTHALQATSDREQAGQKAKVSMANDTRASGSAAVSAGTHQADSRAEIAANKIARHRLVGSSVIVVTIEEVYLPYDLAVRDQRLRNLFPMERGSFYVLERDALQGFPPDRIPDPKLATTNATDTKFFEPVCWLDDAIWNLTLLLDRKSQLRRSLRARNLGRRLGRLTSLAHESTTAATTRLASHLSSRPADPSQGIDRGTIHTAGEQLLARADATAGDTGATCSQIDQVQLDRAREALASWLRTAESIQHWFRLAQQSESDTTISSSRHR